jgi:hypothetical protein
MGFRSICALGLLLIAACDSSDESPDAMPADARAAVDAASSDAAPVADAAVVDGSTVDATESDAMETFDAIAFDATVPDAIVPDASDPDASSVDARPPADASVPPDASVDAAPPPDAGGTCSTDTDCAGTHRVCEASACVCAAGYSLQGNACTWTGVVANPGFTQARSWALQGSTEFDLARSGPYMLDPGSLDFIPVIGGGDPDCTFTQAFFQTIEMPRRSSSEALVILVNYSFGGFQSVAPVIRLGTSTPHEGSGFTDPLRNDYKLERFCLEAGDYAAETTTGRGARVTLKVAHNAINCLQGHTMSMDHVDIVPALPGECPAAP